MIMFSVAGYILHPEQAKGAAIGLYMRFFSKEALQEYMNGGPKSKVVDIMIPHMTGEITVDFESQIEDNENSVYRKGKAFAGGIEHIVYIKVKERTSQDAIDEMVKALNDLNFAPELSSLLVQITAGANFCKVDNRYTHAFVARCPSVEAVQSFSSHPYYIDVSVSIEMCTISSLRNIQRHVIKQTLICCFFNSEASAIRTPYLITTLS
jgi:hypothetical protein